MTKLHRSPSPLPEAARAKIGAALNAALTDGIDLYTQIKVAHWNIKGPHFAGLHPLFDTFATDSSNTNDTIAERSVTLGVLATGTARHVAKNSRLTEYPQETTADLEHVKLLTDRFATYLKGVYAAREVADEHDDQDTVDLLTGVVELFEKHAWFLNATLDK
jgi:starvation-inducible DNA-binding protein